MPEFTIRALSPETWPAYLDLIERHGGIWGGCWCMAFHPEGIQNGETADQRKCAKECRVQEARAHAAIVFAGEEAVGWCQFGPAPEIAPQNKFKRRYLPELEAEPDWRISCFFVDRRFRGQGVASLALDGALRMIAELGGGLVEAYPEAIEGRKIDGRYIYLGTEPMFIKRGFARQRQVSMHNWVMVKHVDPAPTPE